jgi:hypothetical protein
LARNFHFFYSVKGGPSGHEFQKKNNFVFIFLLKKLFELPLYTVSAEKPPSNIITDTVLTHSRNFPLYGSEPSLNFSCTTQLINKLTTTKYIIFNTSLFPNMDGRLVDETVGGRADQGQDQATGIITSIDPHGLLENLTTR